MENYSLRIKRVASSSWFLRKSNKLLPITLAIDFLDKDRLVGNLYREYYYIASVDMESTIVKFKPVHSASLVRFFWHFKSSRIATDFERIAPFGSVDIIIHMNDSMMVKEGQYIRDEPDIFIEGQYTKPVFKKPSKETEFIGISLKPYSTWALLKAPASEFTGNMVPMEDLHHEMHDSFLNIVAGKESVLDKFKQLDLLLSVYELSSLTASEFDIISWFEKHNGTRKNWTFSRRHFQYKYKELFGISHREMMNKLRFQKVLRALLNGEHTTLGELATTCDYYDQAQFNREFKRYAGVPPSQFMYEQTRLKGLCSLA